MMTWDDAAKRRLWRLYGHRWPMTKIAADLGCTETAVRKQLAKMRGELGHIADPRKSSAPGPDDWALQVGCVEQALAVMTKAGIRFEDDPAAPKTEGLWRPPARRIVERSLTGNSSEMCAGLR